jgi:hypothetical protein
MGAGIKQSWLESASSARVKNSGVVCPFLCVNGMHKNIFTFTFYKIQWVAISLSKYGHCHIYIFIGTL